MINFTFNYLQPIGLSPTIIVLFQNIKIPCKHPVTTERGINVGDRRAKHVIYYSDDILDTRLNYRAKTAEATLVLIIGTTGFALFVATLLASIDAWFH